MPTGVNLNQYAGCGSRVPRHCANERQFGLPDEPKVILSTSPRFWVVFNSRHRASGTSPSSIQSDHVDLLVMDGLTHLEYEHSTSIPVLWQASLDVLYLGVRMVTYWSQMVQPKKRSTITQRRQDCRELG